MIRGTASALFAAALLLLLGSTQARADGDPASDYLIELALFLPADANVPAPDRRTLGAVLRQAAQRGFPIRVAVIWRPDDLGSVSALWQKPEQYARFLAAEITYFYRGRLLVVMPGGFGFAHPEHETATEAALLAGIPIAGSPAGLARAATRAVQTLAAARGVRVGGSGPRRWTTRDTFAIVGAALVVLPLGGLLVLQLRRRNQV